MGGQRPSHDGSEWYTGNEPSRDPLRRRLGRRRSTSVSKGTLSPYRSSEMEPCNDQPDVGTTTERSEHVLSTGDGSILMPYHPVARALIIVFDVLQAPSSPSHGIMR